MKMSDLRHFPTLDDSMNVEAVISLMRHQVSCQCHLDVVRCGRWLRKQSAASAQTLQWELISLLELGREQKAARIYRRWADRLSLAPSFRSIFERFLARDVLAQSVESTLDRGRQILGADCVRRRYQSNHLDALSGFSNVILISNNSTLSFSEHDKNAMREMEKPLFVYFNIGNPSLLGERESFYGSEACELLVGGHHHIVDAESRLLFSPSEKHRFLGCLVRVNVRFMELWYGKLRSLAQLNNGGMHFYELDELLLIDALYPLSVFVDGSGLMQRRVPTIGWIALALFDAIRGSLNESMKIWSAGFSLSTDYIFRASGVGLHDFPFEKEALDFRLKQGSLNRLGQLQSTEPELSTRDHLNAAGVQRQQLSQWLRQNQLI